MLGGFPSIDPTAAASRVGPDYAAPATLAEALTLLADSGSAVIAGGTDLVPGVRAGHLEPTVLVDLRRLPLRGIAVGRDYIRLGAGVTFTDILGSAPLAAEYPALVAAAAEVGGPPIRNRATVGGNLVNGSPAADSAPPLLAYGASAVVAAPEGEREVPLSGFFEGPGRTVLQPGEILTEVVLPRPSNPTVSSFVKLGPRLAMAVSIVSAAICVTGDGSGAVARCRIALGAVAPTPIRAENAERIVVSRGLTAESIAAASVAAVEACSTIDDIRAGRISPPDGPGTGRSTVDPTGD